MVKTWPKKPYRWFQDGRWHISIPFTWTLPQVRQEILYRNLFNDDRPIVGGPAVKLMPDYLADIADVGSDMLGVLQRINPNATKTSEGCIRKCGFCAVPRIEKDFIEYESFPIRPILCDNNFMACSDKHRESVYTKLRGLKGIDFNQGLDARLMTKWDAEQLTELKAITRFAWDDVRVETAVLNAIRLMKDTGLPTRYLRCYVLIGFNDTPEDALYRLTTLVAHGVRPNPMRYTPLDSLTGKYVGKNWTEDELIRYMRYWANLRHTSGVPFKQFRCNQHCQKTQQELAIL